MSPKRATESWGSLAVILPMATIGHTAQGLVELWNPGATSIFGWSEEELLSTPPAGHVARGPRDAFRTCLASRNERGLAAGRRIPCGLLALGRRQCLWLKRAPVRDEAEGRLRELLEAAPDAIIEVDREGRIVLLNRVTERLFGYPREELLGASIDVLVPEALRSRHAAHREGYSSHPATRPMGEGFIFAARRRDGSEFPVEISLSPISIGDSFSVMAIVRDVTERIAFEEKIRKANQELEAHNREVEKANRLKSEFLASVESRAAYSAAHNHRIHATPRRRRTRPFERRAEALCWSCSSRFDAPA